MSYVVVYGSLRLELEEDFMRRLGLRNGQCLPNELVAECMRHVNGEVDAAVQRRRAG